MLPIRISEFNKTKQVFDRLQRALGRNPQYEEMAIEMGKKPTDDFIQLIEFIATEEIPISEGEDFEIEFKLSIKNNELKKRRFKTGMIMRKMAEELGMSLSAYSTLEACRRFPSEKEGKKIAKYFGVKPEDIFPNWLIMFKSFYDEKKDRTVIPMRRLELSSPQVLMLEGDSGEDATREANNSMLKELFRGSLIELSDKERKVLEMRMGMYGECQTYERCGKEFGVTRERIRQIEAKALEKIRNDLRRRGITYDKECDSIVRNTAQEFIHTTHLRTWGTCI